MRNDIVIFLLMVIGDFIYDIIKIGYLFSNVVLIEV